MQLGILTKTFVRSNFEAGFDAAKGHGLECVQFNFSCTGLPTLPESIDPALVHRIRSELARRSLFMAAVSGTCNLIHPEPAERAKGLTNLETLIRACRDLGTSVVTLCTGTRDAVDMWRAHPKNHSAEARHDLVKALDKLLPIAQQNGVVLGIEPEPANVIDSAQKARLLFDEMKSPCLKIIFDAANLLQPQTLVTQEKILSEAVDLLGADIVVAHAKDLVPEPHSGFVAAGQGALNYPLVLSLLNQAGFHGPLILHSLREDEVSAAVALLQKQIELLPSRPAGKPDALLPPRPY